MKTKTTKHTKCKKQNPIQIQYEGTYNSIQFFNDLRYEMI